MTPSCFHKEEDDGEGHFFSSLMVFSVDNKEEEKEEDWGRYPNEIAESENKKGRMLPWEHTRGARSRKENKEDFIIIDGERPHLTSSFNRYFYCYYYYFIFLLFIFLVFLLVKQIRYTVELSVQWQ